MDVALGSAVPPHTPHAISVSLPTWRDNVGYEEGEKRVVQNDIQLAEICGQKYAVGNEKCMLFSTHKIAEQCRTFIQQRSTVLGSPVNARLVDLLLSQEDKVGNQVNSENVARPAIQLHIVLFPGDAFSVAKEFWQHTGMGISSRLAERCLSLLPVEAPVSAPRPTSPVSSRYPAKGHNRHYSAVKSSCKLPAPQVPAISAEDLSKDHSTYLEERYGRNLPISSAAFAKKALKSRVAGVLVRDHHDGGESGAEEKELVVGPSTRGVSDVAPSDVYLYPTGMAAIWNAHNLALQAMPTAKSVMFGFPYTDTLKILQKWGPGCHFLGFGLDSDIDELEQILSTESSRDPSKPPILALFTEFPSNPLLRSANLPRLRALADKYGFLIVIDETIGNFLNVEVLPYADILVSSLSKIFSGVANVMGGSLILNPRGRFYGALKTKMGDIYEDIYFDEDAIYMERNSRDFKRRIGVIDENTEAVCDLLYSRSADQCFPKAAVKRVFYPKYVTRANYEYCRIKTPRPEDGREGGFGGLFSLTFTSTAASKAFFDTLPCYKGPSLGTNFTLACPFTILAHYTELDWAAQYGVEEGLVRISVGMEEKAQLLEWVEKALKAAEAAVVSA
ncbi:hypothetical protein CVT24_000297 [Panaeolus cyanescens]|uniref:cystathionine gamma-synthase n=1 Tax=Panaeolus cyanescens TaxID=181874 RepID=A0A409W372_9AGAR|nr:hypothetical protein CVT24_000297 [Panaeolus cyanescens]